MVSMIPAIATTNGQQMLDILALLDSAFEQNLVSGLAFLHQSHADMIRTIVNTTTNFIIVGIIHDFIQLNYHWKLRYQSSFILTNKPPSILLDCWVKLFSFRVQNERIFLDFWHLCHLSFWKNFPSCPCRQEAHVFPCYHRRTLAMFLSWHSQSSGLMVYIRR